MEHYFVTHLSSEECQRRLSGLRQGPRHLDALPEQTGDRGVFGYARGQRFRLYARRVMTRNSFRRLFYGRLQAAPRATLIEGKFQVHPWVRTFMSLGLAFIGSFLLIPLFAAIGRGSSVEWFGIAVPALMLFAGAIMYYFGQKLGEPEEEEILSYIREQLEASRLNGPDDPLQTSR